MEKVWKTSYRRNKLFYYLTFLIPSTLDCIESYVKKDYLGKRFQTNREASTLLATNNGYLLEIEINETTNQFILKNTRTILNN